jgi:CRISPR-associated exonuclease Cas4
MEIELTEKDKEHIENQIDKLTILLSQNEPPKPVKIKYCRHCAHFEFCFS